MRHNDPIIMAIESGIKNHPTYGDPMLWAIKKGHKIEGKDPMLWAIVNDKQIGDASTKDFIAGYTLVPKDVAALNTEEKIQVLKAVATAYLKADTETEKVTLSTKYNDIISAISPGQVPIKVESTVLRTKSEILATKIQKALDEKKEKTAEPVGIKELTESIMLVCPIEVTAKFMKASTTNTGIFTPLYQFAEFLLNMLNSRDVKKEEVELNKIIEAGLSSLIGISKSHTERASSNQSIPMTRG